VAGVAEEWGPFELVAGLSACAAASDFWEGACVGHGCSSGGFIVFVLGILDVLGGDGLVVWKVGCLIHQGSCCQESYTASG
jgi:hypothetical protein